MERLCCVFTCFHIAFHVRRGELLCCYLHIFYLGFMSTPSTAADCLSALNQCCFPTWRHTFELHGKFNFFYSPVALHFQYLLINYKANFTFSLQGFPLFRIAYFVLWTGTFVVFQWIIHACVNLW